MLLSCEQMRKAEDVAFSCGVSAADLMEEAGKGIADVISQFFPKPGNCIAWCGKGNNGGDALVAARHLRSRGWRIQTRFSHPEDQLSDLSKIQKERLGTEDPELSQGTSLVVLDGLLGIGASGTLRGPIASAVEEIHHLRQKRSAFVVALDIPTGLDGDTGTPGPICVEADLTVTIGYAKKGLVEDPATRVVGRLAIVPLPKLEKAEEGDPAECATAPFLAPNWSARCFDSHKGDYGRIGIVAGSSGYYGAARLCSAGAVAGGGGLVRLFAVPETYDALTTSLIPEVMVQRVAHLSEVLDHRLDVLAIGPGVGFKNSREILSIIQRAPVPVIVDADALTILSRDLGVLDKLAGPRLLTPHPGEFERLDPSGEGGRRTRAERFVARNPVTLLLKGARTLVTQAGAPAIYNTTGNPGMGSGGMGDVLTGVCAALMATGKDPRIVAALAAWLCGRSAEIAVFERGESPESLRATHILENLGHAFRQLRQGAL